MNAGDDELPSLTPDELQRYERHLVLPDVGVDGQRRLKGARILVIGVGGLGSPVALYLAAAGIGTLGLADFDVVDVTNLQRQVAHGTADIGRPKLDSARERITGLNPHVRVVTHAERLTSRNALETLRGYDVVVDGTDNFATRYLVNDACVLLGIPNVYGSIFRFEGQASVFSVHDGPCYRCLFPEPPPPDTIPNCAEGGVLGVLPGLLGTIQATEAIKLVLGIGRTLAGRLLLVDALTMEYRTVRVPRDPECPACGTRTITTLTDYDAFCGVPAGAPTDDANDITPERLTELLARGGADLVDVREPHEWNAGHVPGARHVPLGALQEALGSFDPAREIVVMCQSGGRSARAAATLRDAGFTRVRNLMGGMRRWRDDPSREVALRDPR